MIYNPNRSYQSSRRITAIQVGIRKDYTSTWHPGSQELLNFVNPEDIKQKQTNTIQLQIHSFQGLLLQIILRPQQRSTSKSNVMIHTHIFRKKINQDLDICVVIDTVKEINLIKELLLTKDQLVLFDFAPKQAIDLQEDEKSIMTRSQVSSSLESMRTNSNQTAGQKQNQSIQAYYKLFQAYDHIHQQLQQNNKINEKLIEKLGQEVRDIFDVSHFIQWERKQIKCLKDDFEVDSVNSDPNSINNVEQIKINVKMNT